METYIWETISPEVALKYLSYNRKNNRKIRKGVVDKYKRDILNGDWDVASTDNKITFNDRGELIDGQHRLSAIIKAGVPLKMRVFRGVDSRAEIFDRGAVRSTFDILAMSGKYGYLNNEIIACAKCVYKRLFNGTDPTDAEVNKIFDKYYNLILFLKNNNNS